MEGQHLKNLKCKFLTPLLLEWKDENDDPTSQIVFLDLTSSKAYNKDGQEVFGQYVNQAFKDVIESQSKFKQTNTAANVYETSMSMLKKIYEENEELIDGTKRHEGGYIRAWSGGPSTGDEKELGQQENGEVRSETELES